jgi:hypothetical protein
MARRRRRVPRVASASSSRPQLRPMAMEDSLSDVFGVGGVLLHHRPKPRARPRSAVLARQRQPPERPQSTTAGTADAAKEVQVASKAVRPSSAGPRLGGGGGAAVPGAPSTAGDVEKSSAVQAPTSPQWVVERSVSFSEQGPEISVVPSADANLSVDMVHGLQLHGRSAPELALNDVEAFATLGEQSRPGAGRGRGKRFKVLETVALLAGPSMQSARVGTLQQGEIVTVSEVRGHKLFINHRGWCCRRLSDKVLMVQLGGGVAPASITAALRQQQVVRHVALRRREQRGETTRQVRSMRGSEAHGSTATLRTVVRRQRPSSAPVSGRRSVEATNSAPAGPPTTIFAASNVVNGRSLAGAYPAMGGITVPETGASRPGSAGSSRQLYDTETSVFQPESSSAQQIRETQHGAPSQIREGIGAGGLPWQSQRPTAHVVQSEMDLNVDPRLHLADTTVTFHEHSRPGVSADVATAWQSLSMPDASVQKWKVEQGRGTYVRSDAAPAAGASAMAESDTFMMVRGIESSAACSVLDQTHGKIYSSNGEGSNARSSRLTSAPPTSLNMGRPARPSSAPASRDVRVGGRNPNSVGGAGGGDRARLRRPASASERARERRLKLEAAVAVMDQGPVIKIDIPSADTNTDGIDTDSWGPLIDPRVNTQSGDVDTAPTSTQSNDIELSPPRQSVASPSPDSISVSDACGTATSTAGADVASVDLEPDQTGALDPESVEFTAALIEWGRACDAGAEPVGSIPEEQRKVMVAQAEAQRIIGDALEEAVVSQQTELMAHLVGEAGIVTK